MRILLFLTLLHRVAAVEKLRQKLEAALPYTLTLHPFASDFTDRPGVKIYALKTARAK